MMLLPVSLSLGNLSSDLSVTNQYIGGTKKQVVPYLDTNLLSNLRVTTCLLLTQDCRPTRELFSVHLSLERSVSGAVPLAQAPRTTRLAQQDGRRSLIQQADVEQAKVSTMRRRPCSTFMTVEKFCQNTESSLRIGDLLVLLLPGGTLVKEMCAVGGLLPFWKKSAVFGQVVVCSLSEAY